MGKGYTKELIKLAKAAGCEQKRPGGKHFIYFNPDTGETFTIPRSCSVKHTANAICKSAGIDKKF